MATVGRPKKEDKRDIEIRFRVSKEENERIEELAKKMKMNKSRLIRNILLGDLGEMEMLSNVGIIPIVQNAMAFYEKNFKGQNYWDKIKNE
ncbi:MAG: hypothetical protein OQK48_03620 [Sulfurimonas sp.]|uniref:plasmid mobilization protein n=1 Tax=Sulfurimonas sp. TaxID=2022749 RepID=UPI0026029FED|nr:hypothetical protein [Sulfurimonas sp.]MCW8894249.1 hypothetical protein [Sulfurimonas sp.]MCW8954010.1 hypothetical protein [Sulfurimonas sp.]MCW9067064.1 hypothetical protein [Sulfurimonas sp.]